MNLGNWIAAGSVEPMVMTISSMRTASLKATARIALLEVMTMMTDREKLVEMINHVCEGHAENLMLPYGVETLADHLIANGVTVQEWISVEERLPEKIPVLCLDQIGKTSVMRFEYDRLVGRCWFDEYEHLINFDWVTHWMPLPEPPKEE